MNKNILSFVVAICALCSIAYSQPKMEIIASPNFSNDMYDWGKVIVKDPTKQVTLNGEITIKNSGNKPLIIDTIRVGCGCTTPTYEAKKPIAPGETTTIKIGLNVYNNSGEMNKSMTIYANDDVTKNGRAVFLKVNVVRLLTVNPFSLNLPETTVGKESTAKISFKNNDTKPMKILRIMGTRGLKLDKSSNITIKPGETIEVNASFTPTEKGYFNANVIVEVDDKELAPFEIGAYGNVVQ